jgi:hypothetical protein
MTHDGGPAFPVSNLSEVAPQGMSLRDWFAKGAMQGMLGGRMKLDLYCTKGIREVVHYAYLIADEMLKEREAEA